MHRFLRVEKGVLKRCFMPKALVIPLNVTSIGENAFAGCGWLEEVIISDGVTSIGDDAFLGCDSLTLIRLPERFDSPSELKRIGLTVKNCEVTA